jgi:hypothetical protein
MNLHSNKADGAGSARALACIGRRLAGRNNRLKSAFGGAPNATREGACAPRKNNGVALVITLLMLSVITFLTIAFLAMSQRNQSAVSASLDQANARAASDAALARAQTEIIAAMLAHGDPLYYDYMVSRNFISPSNFYGGEGYDPNNVNYDTFLTNPPANYGANWAQNIANLKYDPRPPVFVVTNKAYPNNSDFRFWVDVNRNGRFETNGYQPMVYDNGLQTGYYGFMNGEPEFIGILRNPLYPHSYTNQFISRYAYMVLPVGKELDFNYIHNFLKATQGNVNTLYNSNTFPSTEGFARDQGIGSWELNLAGVLDAVSPWAYESNISGYGPYPSLNPYRPYNYVPPNPSLDDSGLGNTGSAFYDAEALLHYRYGAPTYLLATLQEDFPLIYTNFQNQFIDVFCAEEPVTAPFDYSGTNIPITQTKFNTASQVPWAGSYPTNNFFDVQDLFDPVKTSAFFTNRMMQASERTNTFDRYTFQRLISCIAMGSSPEYGTWVYGDNDGLGTPSQLRTKININYDNTSQITNPKAPYVPMPTNLVPWTPIGFFTNAAELLLRSQTFIYTNYIPAANGAFVLGTPSFLFTHFGITNIPIYRTNNPAIRYNAAVHRMLQLAANIYDATVSTNNPSAQLGGVEVPPVRHPSIFRPLFGATNVGTTNVGIDIIGFVQVTNSGKAIRDVYNQISQQPFYDLGPALTQLLATPTASNINISGIPWVIGANQGLPQFYQYSYNNRVLYERKVQMVRHGTLASPITNEPPLYTNQFYCFSISNNFGLDAFNPYSNYFTGSIAADSKTSVYISNYITIQVTNEYNFVYTTNITNFTSPQQYAYPYWAPWTSSGGSNGFKTFISTNVVTLAPCYYSEVNRQFIFFTNLFWSNQFQSVDSAQKGWPVHNWTLNVTNHVVYALFDGNPLAGGGAALLDFVNLGPFGSSMSITNQAVSAGNGLGMTPAAFGPYWSGLYANDFSSSPMSAGLQYQVWNNVSTSYTEDTPYKNSLVGNPTNCVAGLIFGPPIEPSNVVQEVDTWVANDPIVHYTVDDLTMAPGQADVISQYSVNLEEIPITNSVGTVNKTRYSPWGQGIASQNNMLFKDPLIFGATNWAFPTNKFPGVGWIGRVHRGTPWQTVYLKADSPESQTEQALWAPSWVSTLQTYPTNDWALVDLFTTAPNDNAARGLLSVNQTNDAAWAAVFAGVIAPTNSTNGAQIMPINDVSNLVDANSLYFGINALRTNYPNGIFHKVGDILAASALTTTSPFLTTNGINPATCSDEIIERIPQQTLSLLKVGEPQFVIFGWGQALKPKGPPYLTSLPGGQNNNIYTNYEITGEVLTRTVCHLVHTNGVPKMVIDSYNVESGSGN